jgi:hypothetical protein
VGEQKHIDSGGMSFDVEEMAAVDKKEQYNEYMLEDGAIIRVSNPATIIYKVVGSSDMEGNPSYVVKLGTAVTVVRGPKK